MRLRIDPTLHRGQSAVRIGEREVGPDESLVAVAMARVGADRASACLAMQLWLIAMLVTPRGRNAIVARGWRPRRSALHGPAM